MFQNEKSLFQNDIFFYDKFYIMKNETCGTI